jgi:Terpene cyclase DEP1
VADWFANDASSSVAVDLIVVAVVASVFMVTESRRVGIRLPVALTFVVGGFLVAMACAFPLFLLLRERRLAPRSGSREPREAQQRS